MTTHNSIPDDYLHLGKLGKTYQLEGGLRFYPLGDAEGEAVFELKRVFLEGLGECDVRRVRMVGKHIVLYLTRALTVEAARALVNLMVYAPADALPVPEDDDIYIDDLLEQPVFLDGAAFGTVEEVMDAGMQDVLLIRRMQGGEVMVPLQAPYVDVTDDGVYLENPPEGLLEG